MGFNGDLYPTAGAEAVMTTKGDMVDYDTARQRLGIGSANQILQVKSNLPSWETVPLADTVLTTAGDVLYENATPELARLPIASNGDVLTLAGGLPSWVTPASGGATCTTQNVSPTNASTYTGGSYVALTGTTNIVLPTRTGGKALLTYDMCGEKNSTGYIGIGFEIATVGVTSHSLINVSTASGGLGGSVSAIHDLDGADYQMVIMMNGGTTTVYNSAVSGTTQMLSYEVS